MSEDVSIGSIVATLCELQRTVEQLSAIVEALDKRVVDLAYGLRKCSSVSATCHHCQRLFARPDEDGTAPQYCSDSCRDQQAAANELGRRKRGVAARRRLKKKILQAFAQLHEYSYPSDVAAMLNADALEVKELCDELLRDGKLASWTDGRLKPTA